MQESRILITIASWNEAKEVAAHLLLEKDESFVLKDRHQPNCGLYTKKGSRTSLLVTGVLEHNMVSAVSCLLLKHPNVFSVIINFGCCGYYNRTETKSEAYFVSKSKRFDVDDNVHWTPEISLIIPEFATSSQTTICASGSRFSNKEDYLSQHFPSEAEIEDMELYGLACLCNTIDVPLYAIKYPVNEVCSNGREQLRKNILVEQKRASNMLYYLLENLNF